jgi:spore germination cell wall hydrolase CwlJ-like protein
MKRIEIIGLVAITCLLVSNVIVIKSVNQIGSEVETIKEDLDEVKRVVIYKTKERLAISDKEMDCLAKNIFHEAGVEDRAGKIAVAQVTVNRLRDGRWGRNICDVVYAKSQFSWTLYKKKRYSQPKGPLWEESVRVAHEFANLGKRVKGIESSIMYHADYIDPPKWARKMPVAIKIGQHIFYERI